jgi:hypothetical protein
MLMEDADLSSDRRLDENGTGQENAHTGMDRGGGGGGGVGVDCDVDDDADDDAIFNSEHDDDDDNGGATNAYADERPMRVDSNPTRSESVVNITAILIIILILIGRRSSDRHSIGIGVGECHGHGSWVGWGKLPGPKWPNSGKIPAKYSTSNST